MDDQDIVNIFCRWWERDGHWLYTKARALEMWQKRGIEYLPGCTPGAPSLLSEWVEEERCTKQTDQTKVQTNSLCTSMVGRRVKPLMEPNEGTVIKWEPLNSSMCDALVRFDDGHECWYSSSWPNLEPVDWLGPLPSRQEARKAADETALHQLREILAQHVKDCGPGGKRWPGMEFAKGLFGRSCDGAIEEVEGRIKSRKG